MPSAEPVAVPTLEMLREAAGDRLGLVYADMLLVDESELLATHVAPQSWEDKPSVKIVGNLPFGVSTQLLVKWLKQIPTRRGAFAYGRTDMSLTFQLEVAKRIVADSGNKEYGRLSVLTQMYCQPGMGFTLDPRVFVPQPKVTGAVVHIRPLVSPLVDGVLRYAAATRR